MNESTIKNYTLSFPAKRNADNLFEHRYAVLLFGVFFLGIVILRNAWVSEDSYITFRTIDNFVNGYGLRWNIAERVQTYSNPLWLMVMTVFYSLTSEIYYTSIFVSVAVSLAAATGLFLSFSKSRAATLLAVSALVCSKAFIDFSTSGLENALSHLLLILFYSRVVKLSQTQQHQPRDVFIASLLAALVMVNRLDHAILCVPALVWLLFRKPFGHGLRWILLGMLPIILWELFCIIYYGFPFPNTAYAKLSNGLGQVELWSQGFFYLFNSLSWDPITLFVVGAAIVKVGISRRTADILIVLGVMGYLLYVVSVGGDHMSGRFFTAGFFLSVAVLAQSKFDNIANVAATLAAIVVLGWLSENLPLSSGEDQKRRVVVNGIADERGYFYHGSGFLRMGRESPFHQSGWAKRGIEERKKGAHTYVIKMIGWFGFYAGPQIHVIDPLALSDPLLARIPRRLGGWRVAHYIRDIPKGYKEAAFSGKGQIEDPALRTYFNRLKMITRKPVFSLERWKTIWRMNTGQYDSLINAFCRSEYSIFRYQRVSKLLVGEHKLSEKAILLNRYGIGIAMDHKRFTGKQIEMALSAGAYDVMLYRDHRQVEGIKVVVKEKEEDAEYLQKVTAQVTADSARQGYDQIRIYPRPRDAQQSFGGITVH